MTKRGPAPGSGRSGGAAAVAHRWKGSASIVRALDLLERAIRTAALRGDVRYAEAEALYLRMSAMAETLNASVVCEAADYPEE